MLDDFTISLVNAQISLDADVNLVQNGTNDVLERQLTQGISSVDRQPAEKTTQKDKGENVNLRISLDVPIRIPGMEDQLPHDSSNLNSHGTLDDPDIVELNPDVLEDRAVGDSNRTFSTSVLEKIFGGTLSMNDNGLSSAEVSKFLSESLLVLFYPTTAKLSVY